MQDFYKDNEEEFIDSIQFTDYEFLDYETGISRNGFSIIYLQFLMLNVNAYNYKNCFWNNAFN